MGIGEIIKSWNERIICWEELWMECDETLEIKKVIVGQWHEGHMKLENIGLIETNDVQEKVFINF
jgi:hypothetical protein